MIRRALLVAALSFGLAACATTTPPQDILANLQKFLIAVQVEAQKYCGVAVPIADLSVLVTGGSTVAMTASAWAHAICGAVAQQQPQLIQAKRRGLRVADYVIVVVNGIPIHVK
jgi:hypothetical protein